MNSTVLIILMLVLSSVAAGVMRMRATKADQDPANIAKDEEAEKKYASLCEAGESIRVVCRGYKTDYYVLTTKRLMIDSKKGLTSIPLENITKVKFQKSDGGKARQASDCQIMTVYADKRHTMCRYSEKFDEIVASFFHTWN